MNNPAMARRIQQRRRQRRRRNADVILRQSVIAVMATTGGATGILIGAVIVNFIWPSHPIYVSIREWLASIF